MGIIASEACTAVVDALSRAEVDQEKTQHLDLVMGDRRVNVGGNHLASKPETWEKSSNADAFCKIQIDGMDQSKFSLPRCEDYKERDRCHSLWPLRILLCHALRLSQGQ